VVATYTRSLGFGDALLSPELAAGHQTSPLLGTILVQTSDPSAVARRLRALAPRYPGLRVSDRASLAGATDGDREANRWLGPLFVVIIFAFTSIAVVNTLTMIVLQRGRELGLLRLVGGTPGQVRSMALASTDPPAGSRLDWASRVREYALERAKRICRVDESSPPQA
jgi:putative ABC transport system permease protein